MNTYIPKKNGAKALIIVGNKILLYRRDNKQTIPYPDHWDFFGGGVEGNESFEDALRREIKEEISLEPERVWYIGKKIYQGNRITTRFICWISENTLKRAHFGDEGQEFRLFTLKEIVDLKIVPAYKRFISLNETIIEEILLGKKVDPAQFVIED